MSDEKKPLFEVTFTMTNAEGAKRHVVINTTGCLYALGILVLAIVIAILSSSCAPAEQQTTAAQACNEFTLEWNVGVLDGSIEPGCPMPSCPWVRGTCDEEELERCFASLDVNSCEEFHNDAAIYCLPTVCQ